MIIYRNPELQSHLNVLSFRFPEIGDVVTDETWHAENISSGFSRLYLIERGEGEIIFNGERTVLRPGHAYLIPPGQRYSYGSSSFVDKIYFHFNLLRPDGYDYFRDFDRVAEVPFLVERISSLRKLFLSNEPLRGAVTAEVTVAGILADILTAYPYSPAYADKLSETTAAAVAYIRSHLTAALTVQQIAQAQSHSPGHLAKCFKTEIGCSVPQYIEDQIFRLAEEKLIYSDLSIGDIAAEFGFCDQFYFSRRFKSRFGFTPSQYRRAMRYGD